MKISHTGRETKVSSAADRPLFFGVSFSAFGEFVSHPVPGLSDGS